MIEKHLRPEDYMDRADQCGRLLPSGHIVPAGSAIAQGIGSVAVREQDLVRAIRLGWKDTGISTIIDGETCPVVSRQQPPEFNPEVWAMALQATGGNENVWAAPMPGESKRDAQDRDAAMWWARNSWKLPDDRLNGGSIGWLFFAALMFILAITLGAGQV